MAEEGTRFADLDRAELAQALTYTEEVLSDSNWEWQGRQLVLANIAALVDYAEMIREARRRGFTNNGNTLTLH
jgi:hypothetical protein